MPRTDESNIVSKDTPKAMQTASSKWPGVENTDNRTHGARPENGDFRKPSMTLPGLLRLRTTRLYGSVLPKSVL